MAYRFPSEDKVQLKTRKGHDMKWLCDKHAEPITSHCKKHKIPICRRCASEDHGKKTCVLEDIEYVILEFRRKLKDRQTKIAPAKKHLEKLRSKFESSETSASNHLQSVNNEINATYDRKLKSMKDKERDEIRLINQEADEEIRIINEKRERRIKACKEEAQKQQQQQQISKDIQANLLSEIDKINVTVRKKFEDLRSKYQREINTIDTMDSKIERIKQDDKTLVNEAPQVIASLDESLSSNVHQEVTDCLDRIEREVLRVKFVKGEVGGEHYGRIDGYIGKWELVKSIDISSVVTSPRLGGLISDCDICVLDDSDNSIHVTNIITEHTKKVTGGDRSMCVTSCAPVDSKVIVCGKDRGYCSGDSLDWHITLYDRQWKVVRDITIPSNIITLSGTVYVDVDRDGMLLAVQYAQSNIYVINPADGKIVNTITMTGEKEWGEIQALSSGDIVAREDTDNDFTVISQSGEEKAVLHYGATGEWSRCYVDKLTDTIYITYEDEEPDVFVVDQVSCDGDIQARRILECHTSYSKIVSPCLVTPSGNLVVCDWRKIVVYKKSFIV